MCTFVRMRTNTSKSGIGENILYFLVWTMALLVPILNSQMMSEDHINLVNILIVWSKLAPYIMIFAVNNYLLSQMTEDISWQEQTSLAPEFKLGISS